MNRQRRNALVTIGLTIGLPFHGEAQENARNYPTRPMRLLVPSGAGSPVDVIARRLADFLAPRLHVAVVVENKAGASGSIAAAEVARATPDGHTLMVSVGDPVVGALATIKGLSYDPRKDFSFISKIVTSSTVMAGRSGLAPSLRELVAERKKSKVDLTYASYGPGSFPQLIVETMAKVAGIGVREIPYRSAPSALNAVTAGEIDIVLTAATALSPLVIAGRLSALAVVGDKRSPLFPDVPTFGETGYHDFVFKNKVWVGLTGPAALPAAVVQRLSSEIAAAAADPDFRSFVAERGYDLYASSPAVFRDEHRAEIEAITKLIAELGVAPK